MSKELSVEAGIELGTLAESHARAMAIDTFGAGVFKRAAEELSISFATGLDRGIVDAAWKQHEPFFTSALRSNKKKLARAAKVFVEEGRAATKAYGALKSQGFPPAKLTKWADELSQAARGVLEGAPGARAGFKTAERQARALAKNLKTSWAWAARTSGLSATLPRASGWQTR